MAKVLGQSARYTSEQAVKDHVRVMLHCLIMVALFAAVEGACLAKFVPVALLPPWLRLFALPISAFGGLWILIKWGGKRLQTLAKDQAAMRRGASGEILVGLILSDFPDEFYVINDLTTAYGNLDHVVIGPTGVFVLDTKNWRGVVTPDSKGELLLNGRKLEKDFVRQLVGRMLGVRDKVRLLAPGAQTHFITPFWCSPQHGLMRSGVLPVPRTASVRSSFTITLWKRRW